MNLRAAGAPGATNPINQIIWLIIVELILLLLHGVFNLNFNNQSSLVSTKNKTFYLNQGTHD